MRATEAGAELRRAKLRRRMPPPMSSTTASATSAATRVRCVRRDDPLPVVRPDAARRIAAGATRVPRHAGRTPNSSVVATMSPAVNAAIRTSISSALAR